MIILIVDNSEHIIDRLESLLLEVDSKASIYRAKTYKDAMTLYKKYKPDVALFDISLPCKRAIEFLKEIKKTGYKTCVIILSILADKNIIEQCKLQGADFFLDKYHEFEKIPAIVNEIVKTKNIQEEKNS